MNKKAAGFTIIELIVVIALLGILSAVALPRFMDVTDGAHDAAVSGAGAGFATGVALIRAQAIAEGISGGGNVTGFGDGSMFVNASGAVVGQSATLDCVEVWEGLLQSNAPTVAAGVRADETEDYVVADAAGAAGVCTYEYRTAHPENDERTIVYSSNDRSVDVNAEGVNAP